MVGSGYSCGKDAVSAVQTLCERDVERGIERDESLLDAKTAWLRCKNIIV